MSAIEFAARNTVRHLFALGILAALLAPIGAFAQTTTYEYDDLGRLKTVSYPDGAQRSFTLDPAGNRDQVTDVPPFPTPQGLTATVASSTQVNLSWNAVTAPVGTTLAGYKILRNGSQVATTTATSYSDSALAASTTYTYRVAAYSTVPTTSAPSAPKVVTTLADTTPPTTPGGFTATPASSTQVNLSWSASTDAGGSGFAGYRVFRDGVALPLTTSTTYNDTGLTPWTLYSYTVRAYDGAGNASTAPAALSVRTPDPFAPSVPTGLNGTPVSSSQIDLTWNASTDTGGSGVASYTVVRNGTPLTPTTTTSFSDTGLAEYTLYNYQVRATDGSGNNSALSAVVQKRTLDTTPPTDINDLATTVLSASSVRLNWSPASDTGSGVQKYVIYKYGASYSETTGTTFTDSSVASGITVYYEVHAYDNSGNRAPGGNVATANTDTTPPGVPQQLSVHHSAQGGVQLTWASVTDTGGSGLAGYRVYRDNVRIAEPGTGVSPGYHDVNPPANVTVTYTVAAYDGAGNESGRSTPAPIYTDTIAPTTPTGLVATNVTYNQVDLAWNASSDAGGTPQYIVTRSPGFGGILIGSATTYSDTSVASGTTYTYSVQATDLAANTSAPASVQVTTPSGAPSNPTLGGQDIRASGPFTIVWGASTGPVAYYILEQATSPDFPPGAVTSFQVNAPTTQKTFNYGLGEWYYRVKACTSGGVCSGYGGPRYVRIGNQ